MAYSQPMIEAGTTRMGRWLRERRIRLTLWVAVIEGVLVAVTADLTKWTVLVIAAILLAFYIVAGRNLRWESGASCRGSPRRRRRSRSSSSSWLSSSGSWRSSRS
jgi:hypothetical protein